MPLIYVIYQVVEKNQHHDQWNYNNDMKQAHMEYESAHKIYPKLILTQSCNMHHIRFGYRVT